VEIRPPDAAPVRPRTSRIDSDEYELESAPQGLPVVVYEVDDDATRARGTAGAVASGGQAEALVFHEPFDSGLGLFGLLVASEVGNFHSVGMEFDNWGGAGFISGYDILVYNSQLFSGPATVRLALWDGDPDGLFDTACSDGGIPKPIPGTTAVFSGLPQGVGPCPALEDGSIPQDVDPGGFDPDAEACVGLYRLKATLPSKVQVDCDRAWLTLELLEGCRLAWRFGDHDLGPQVGFMTRFFIKTSLDQSQGPRECCDTGASCTSGADCSHADFCSDGILDSYASGASDPGSMQPYFVSFVSTVRAPTDFVIYGLPVSADQKPGVTPATSGWSVSGNEIHLDYGDRNVWIDWHVTDWDPDETGRWPVAWQLSFEESSFSTGLAGTLDYYRPFCTEDAHCELGVGPGVECEPAPFYCTPGYVDGNRPDYIYFGGEQVGPVINATSTFVAQSVLHDVNEVRPNYKCVGGAVPGKLCSPTLCPDANAPCFDPSAGPDDFHSGCNGAPPDTPDGFCRVNHEDRYLVTMTLAVPGDARGAFSIGLVPPGADLVDSTLIDDDTRDPFPLMAIVPAQIVVDVGSCCYNLSSSTPQCEELKTRAECDALPGPRLFRPNESCNFPCPEETACCLPNNTCGELLPFDCEFAGGSLIAECLGDSNSDGLDDACVTPPPPPQEPVPAASAWTLLVLVLSLAALARLSFKRSPTGAAAR
jgi:hypothetical protein